MHLVYVDEFGTSGGRLDNPDESFFSLTAVVVDERNWRQLENNILSLKNELIAALVEKNPDFDQHHKVEFHAAEFLQGKKFYGSLSLTERLDFTERLLKIGHDADVYYQVMTIEKSMIARYREELDTHAGNWHMEPWWPAGVQPRTLHDLTEKRVNPYTLAFSGLIDMLESWLLRRGKRGLLILDETSQHRKLSELHAYGELRLSGAIKNLVAAPFFVSSHIHAPMQLADLISYLTGRHRTFQRRGEETRPPVIQEWLMKYVNVRALDYGKQRVVESNPQISTRILRELVPGPSGNSETARQINELADGIIEAIFRSSYMERVDPGKKKER